MKLDIHAAVIMAVIVTILGALLCVWIALDSIRKGRDAVYYRIRHKLVVNGWWMMVLAAALVLLAIFIAMVMEPVAYVFFPPSPTNSATPTISPTPTISLTPTITEIPSVTPTPAVSYTPTITTTPFVPLSIETQFTSPVTPDAAETFSPLTFSRTVLNYVAQDPQTAFQNPVQKLYATYSYDGMTNGVQWTMLWYRGSELLKYETSPWEGGTGGYGQYTLELPVEEWLPGTYQVIFFVGTEWKVAGEFRINGNPPSPTPTALPSHTPTATLTLVPSRTLRPTDTRWPTLAPAR